SERTIFTFPTGTRSGSCLHAILERLDFTASDVPGRRALVERELRRFGFSTEWTGVVETLLDRVLRTPLDARGRIRLADVSRDRRLDELEFTYPLRDFGAAALRDVLRAGGFAAGPFADAIDALAFAPVSGFMRGFIDLVFEADGRYWIVDYK